MNSCRHLLKLLSRLSVFAALGVVGLNSSCKPTSQDPVSNHDGGHAGTEASGRPPGAPINDFLPRTPRGRAGSMIELLAARDQLDGARAMVAGFLVLKESEGGVGGTLHLSREDWEFGLMNSVPIEFGPCRRSRTDEPLLSRGDAVASVSGKGYAVVRGTFEARAGGTAAGTICAVTSITALEERSKAHGETASQNKP
jgi:hypothetical protein